MWAIVIATALTYGLIRAAMARPAVREELARGRLAELAARLEPGRRQLSLDEAADGVVLARRFGQGGLEQKFKAQISKMRTRAEPASLAGSVASRESLGTLPGFPKRSSRKV